MSFGRSKNGAVYRAGLVHEKTVSLGIQDSKLPDIDKGIAFLQKQGYRVVVRNSGGLAVVLDSGVLNLSMVLPDAERGIAIERGYETMFTLIKDMFVDCNEVIEAKEIETLIVLVVMTLVFKGKSLPVFLSVEWQKG